MVLTPQNPFPPHSCASASGATRAMHLRLDPLWKQFAGLLQEYVPHAPSAVYDTFGPSYEDSVQAVRVALGAGGVSFDLISTHILKHRFAMEPHHGQLPNLPYSGHPIRSSHFVTSK
ncbi:uncharacterized protein TrAtP1_001675 [Trichoderma atroviride]|uniref:uncharacterized protein n=1 Tax=Hypocrea atroviridis TaxID=63577 RepID=UPI003326C962|nr:hypothetical protein TrAtP1_001675 [Trichoderma atroviride]